MALSNTAVPRYYGEFREKAIKGEIPVCKEISMEMNRTGDTIKMELMDILKGEYINPHVSIWYSNHS